MRRTLRRSVRTAQSPRTYFWKVFSESEVSALDRTDRWEARGALDRPSAEPAHPAQPRADGGGLGGLGRPRGDRAPGQLVEHRLPAAVGQPAGK
jgi:hypothetical protein